MGKNNTITLSAKEIKTLEQLIAKHGNIVVFDMIHELMKNEGRQEVKNFISNLTKKGWLIRIKRGSFVISDISNRGTVNLNQLTIAQIINSRSYISFEAALQYYGLFDQYLRVITSISEKKTYSKEFSNWKFRYIKTKKGLFNNYKEFNMDGRLVKIASKEKVILDFLTYRRSVSSIDLIIEKLKNHKNDFDIKKLIEISKDYSITVRRTLGFILDLVNVDYSDLYLTVKGDKNYSFMTSNSKLFNSKWRIYIDNKFKD